MVNFSNQNQFGNSRNGAYGCCLFGIIVAIFAAAWYVLKYAFRAFMWMLKYSAIGMYYAIAAPFLIFEYLWRRGGLWRPILLVVAGSVFLLALVSYIVSPPKPARSPVVVSATATAHATQAATDTPSTATPVAATQPLVAPTESIATAAVKTVVVATVVPIADTATAIPVMVATETTLSAAVVTPVAAGGDRVAAHISAVVDGDTVKLSYLGTTEYIRMLGVDTPETKDPRKPVQCFGAEASRFTKETLLNQDVTISFDETQGTRDKYNRLLLYIWLPDGTLFNKLLISEGYAFEYTYNKPYLYQAEFKAAQADARTAARGLWAPTSCNGVASPVTPTP